MSNICFKLNNTIDISNNFYLFNNDNSILGDLSGTYGLYKTEENIIYTIKNIPKTHPIGFYDASGVTEIVDISNLIEYNISYEEPIIIYVSKGSDLSFNNGDYYRFYDVSYKILNISGSTVPSRISDSKDNFYFMRSMKYTFIAIEDFCSNHPFALSGEALNGLNYDDFSLQKINDSFDITIPKDTDNKSNIIYYLDDRQNDISNQLSILVDPSNISYYYGDISFSIKEKYEQIYDASKISIKSFKLDEINQVNNVNLFVYDTTCDYILKENTQYLDILYNQGKECLNIVSEAKLDTSDNNISYYEFNLKNHGRDEFNSKELLYNLNYGLYDGSYTIINVDSNYPFTIINNDISNAIKIDEINTTGILHKSDPKINTLGEPLNTYNYYYDTVRILIDNSRGTLIQNQIIPIHILDLNLNRSYEPSNNFFYTAFCVDSDDVNNIQYRDLSFVLFNQKDIPFTSDYVNNIDNIYYLNLYQEYTEPSTPYALVDRYNHDISNLIISTKPVETILSDGTILPNTHQINYDLSYFIITYTGTDYEKQSVSLNRLVEIRRGPFIEVVDNYEIFNNSNPFTNTIDIPTNTISSSYNFFQNLDVFVYDIYANKINLPFEISVTGEYYLSNSIYQDPYIQNYNREILKYNNIDVLGDTANNLPLKFNNDDSNFLKNYYLSKNIQFNYTSDTTFKIDELGFRIFNINTININVTLDNPLLDIANLFHFNEIQGNILSYKDFVINPEHTKITSLYLDGDNVYINNINNSLSRIDISQNYNDFGTNYNLLSNVEIDNHTFTITITDINNSNNNFVIDGTFNEIDFFNLNNIDARYIGNYQLKLDIKGLSDEDFIFNDIKDKLDVASLLLNYSRTFNINVIDNQGENGAELNFVNTNVINPPPNPLLYEFKYSVDFSFNIFTDISFFKKTDTFFENTNTPLLEFSDNSIYDGSLTYDIYPGNNIVQTYDNGYYIHADDQLLDAEAVIKYTAYDLCGNKTNDVSLNIIFSNIPIISLIGSRVEQVPVNYSYNEPGIIIKNSLGNITYIPSNEPFTESSSSNTINNPTGYDISWSLNLDITTLGIYELIYEVTKTGLSEYNSIKRIIEVVDIQFPFFRFPKLSTITEYKGYIDGSNDHDFVAIKDNLYDNTYTNQFNIDLSLTVYSSLDELTYIINQFEIDDNYFKGDELTSTITLSIDGEGEISFDETGLKNVFSNNNGYLNSDNSFNKVTIGINKLVPLEFNYKVKDKNDNSFNITRIVDIVDVDKPLIDFSFNNKKDTDIDFAKFSPDYKDFSYQALNYLKNTNTDLILRELSSIIFDFSLSDNYSVVNSNYIITISGVTINHRQENIKTIEDISNNIISLSLFSQIDTSLIIIYEISDNQYNYNQINRKVDIINTVKPAINFINKFDYDDRIYIDFGDNKYDIKEDFTLFHSRINMNDVTFDLSYILPPNITSLSGEYKYDPSALFYSVSGDISSVHYDVGFYAITTDKIIDTSSELLNIKLIVTNSGPFFNEIPYIDIEGVQSPNIIHEATEFFNDASFLFGVNAISEYDKFYYTNYLPDISYLSTNFYITHESSFNVYNPHLGTYKSVYTVTDKNNQTEKLTRYIYVNDTTPPIISLSNDVININQFEELVMPNAFFNDLGSYLSTINIILNNSRNTFSKDISYLTFNTRKDTSIPIVYSYNFSSSELLLTSNDTSNSSINYELIYEASDRFNNSGTKKLTINIIKTTDFVIKPKLSISGYKYDLDLNFNNNFINLIKDETNNLESIFNQDDIQYDADNKIIKYEVKKSPYFNLLEFDIHTRYLDYVIPDYNNTIIDNIISNLTGNYRIVFQSFNDSNFESAIEEIIFNIVDTTPPKLSFTLVPGYENMSDIRLPVISDKTYATLKTNIFYLENNNLYHPYYFGKDLNNNIIFNIPGIDIDDVTGGKTESLFNETLSSDFDNKLSLYISYLKFLPSGNYDINQGITFNLSQIHQTSQYITVNPNLLDSAINITIDNANVGLVQDTQLLGIVGNIQLDQAGSNSGVISTVSSSNNGGVSDPGYSAYIKFIYIDGTVHIFRHRGNGFRQFYNSNTSSWSNIFGLGDHSTEIMSYTGNTTKNYLIECTKVIGVSTWKFNALDGGISQIELFENTDSNSNGMLGVEINETPIFDISNSYLLFNEGKYIQNYKVFDSYGNVSDISRNITVERLEPFINLNYTIDANRNIYLKTYHKVFSAYLDILGRSYDYYLGEFVGNSINTIKSLNQDILGVQTIKYDLKNYPNTLAERDVHVVYIDCLPLKTIGFENLITKGIHYKRGLYTDKYIINIKNESEAFRIFGYNYDYNYNIDITNLISIVSENVVNYGGYEYYWGEIELTVHDNFNRASIEYLDENLNKIVVEDIFIYTDECFQILINQILYKPLPTNSFRVDVSGYNVEDIEYQYFTLSGELYPSLEDVNRYTITDVSRANIHLAMGRYSFIQDTEKNFYNRIKFSLTEDGTHNGGIEYTKGVVEYSLPGLEGGRTDLIISTTTPSPLYYYSEHFPNMGGKIETRNNLVISSGNIYVNDNVLSVENSSVLRNFNTEEELLNKIVLSQKFNLIGINGNTENRNNVNINCITQQNINHNILTNKSKNLLIFKKYQSSPNYDPVNEGIVSYVPSYDENNEHANISNVNLKHDISNHYLFDFNVNQYQSYVLQYDYRLDTAVNLLANLSINTLIEEIAVAVGIGDEHTLAYSLNNGITWTGIGKNLLDINGQDVAFNGSTRFVAVGDGNIHKIIYSDNGIEWFPSIDSKLIFDEYAKAVVYDNSNSYWLVGGKGSVNTMAYSIDSVEWIGLGKSIFENKINGFSKHHNDKFILALGNGGNTNNSIAYSSNGLNWFGGTSNNIRNTKSIFSIEGNNAIYYDKNNIWIAVGEGEDNSIAYSYDGIEWNGLGKARILKGNDIDANDKMIVIVGKQYETINFSSIIYSYNGFQWFDSESSIFSECNSVVWTGTVWIATGLGNTGKIALSNNGIIWSSIDNTINIFSNMGLGIDGNVKKKLIRDSDDILYEMSILDLFNPNSEINNYSHFFRRNDLLTVNFIKSNFISKINELRYTNHVSLIDNNDIFHYFLDKYLTSDRIIFSHILDNWITFNLQTYLDIDNININKNVLDKLYKHNTNYEIDNNNLLFNEYIVNIWSDICGNLPEIIKSPEESILLHKSLIELNEYLLDSQNSNNLLYKLYDDVLNTDGEAEVEYQLKEKVFLSVRDNNMKSYDYNQYIGITSQNIHHNMYIDENHVLIFHKYQNLTNNFKINEPELTLEETLSDFSNNKKYLLELSSNDIYGCFTNSKNNIYENSNKKNEVIIQNPLKYKSFIAYFFMNEISLEDENLSKFDIRPISLNRIDYNKYPYSYDYNLQKLHSHSYVIDLNDYFDRYIYDNPDLEVPANMYNKSLLSYTIYDISYINNFNIFDIKSNQNIIYDKTKIEVLNLIQDLLIIINYKIDYLQDIIYSNLLIKKIPYRYVLTDYELTNTVNVQNMNILYNSINIISTNYQLTLLNNTINGLFSNNFYNFNQLTKKFIRLEEIIMYYQNINIDENIDKYKNINNFNNVDQLLTDVELLNSNIENIINNNIYFTLNSNNIENIILSQEKYLFYNSYYQFDILYRLLKNYREMIDKYNNIIFELNTRHINDGIFSNVNIIDNTYNNLHDINNVKEFTSKLFNNYVTLDDVLKNQISYSNIYIETEGGTNNIPNTNFSYTYNQLNINIVDFSNSTNNIIDNYNYLVNGIRKNYNFENKERVYDGINYLMSGSKLLINSFKSNNILIKFDIRYNSYLYPDKYVDTVVLDLAIPDYIPPTLIFNNPNILISQKMSTILDNNIDNLLKILIDDISFIEINQIIEEDNKYDMCYNFTNIFYHDIQFNAFVNSNIINNVYSTIEIDIRNMYNENTNFPTVISPIDIYYTVIDNANNRNTITRTINVERAFEYPEFFINNQLYGDYILSLNGVNWSFIIEKDTILTNEMLLLNIKAIDSAAGGLRLPIEVNNIIENTNTAGIYENAITYTAVSSKGVGIKTVITRDLIITSDNVELEEENNDNEEQVYDPCPCPVYYKPIQHNYKLGSNASNVMRLSKIIMRRY